MNENEIAHWKCKFKVEKRQGNIDLCQTPTQRLAFLDEVKPFEIIEGEDNCLLNSGIDEMWNLITGAASGTNHTFDNAKAQIGVGNSNTAAAATQTDLVGASKTYKAMEAGFPTSTTQKATFKSSFGSGDANYAWAEWVVKQLTSAICLNRKVDAMGTKTSGSTWTLEVSITLS